MSARSLNILVAASVASTPRQGGWIWAVLQYVLGLRQLGHRVVWVDSIAESALSSQRTSLDDLPGAREFQRTISSFGLTQDAALVVRETRQTIGRSYESLQEFARGAEVLLNLSGSLRDPALRDPPRIRAYVDLDPGFTQLWHDAQGLDLGFDGHSHFLTVGMSIGQKQCTVPSCGKKWITTPQPIALEHWPRADSSHTDAFTTVANWRGYGSIDHGGTFYGQKAHSLRPLISLPTHTREKLLLALAIHPEEGKDLAALWSNGWKMVDPLDFASTPQAFQHFVQTSKGEFAVAKSGYALSKCGWFSDRSLCYLASGRPVVAQDTGMSQFIPTGEGVVEFNDLQSAVVALESVANHYTAHRAAARAIAENVFDSKRVLSNLLERMV